MYEDVDQPGAFFFLFLFSFLNQSRDCLPVRSSTITLPDLPSLEPATHGHDVTNRD